MTDLLELGNYTILSPHPHSHDPGNAGKGKGKERPTVAVHHQTGEEFEIVSFPRSELTPQKIAELQQELLAAQCLKAHPNLRLLVEVLDRPECVFLLYTTAHPRSRGKRSPSPVSLYHSDAGSEYPSAAPAPFTPGEIPLLEYVMKSGRLEEDEAKVIFAQLARLVLSCHQSRVVLRDLKLPSILIDPATKVVRLADFKQATLLESPDQLLTDRRGSPAYVSPDVLIGKPYSGQKADSWSLGVILYAMLCGNFPFIGPSPKEIFQRILTSPPAYPSHLSQQASALVQGLLRPSAATRLAVHEALNHPWLSFDDDEDQVVPDF